MSTTQFHAGEFAAQERAGAREQVNGYAREMIRPFMPVQHRDFYEQLPFIVATARDNQGRPWTTILAGKPGFIQAVGKDKLNIAAKPAATDALANALSKQADIGLLGIEPDTRRRNRVNGSLSSTQGASLQFSTRQSFGNCPQYITEREWEWAPIASEQVQGTTSHSLNAAQAQWITQADTFFIGSGYQGDPEGSEANGLDASHRGGTSGFVEVPNSKTVLFPDYAGNKHFNTIGNLLVDPRVALLFVDFENGHLLQLTGRARIDWDSAAVAKREGAQRLVIIDIEELVEQRHVLPIRWKTLGAAPLTLRVAERVEESSSITSFLLESTDGLPLPEFQPGQHLPICLLGSSSSANRTYSLSSAPQNSQYRISVKREAHGLVSRQLHDHFGKGDTLHAWQPAGDFVLRNNQRTAVLISAGVGITPMMSMLEHLISTGPTRDIVFLHGARNGTQQAFTHELEHIKQNHPGVTMRKLFSQPDAADTIGENYDARGRIKFSEVQTLLPSLDAEFYLCGPAAMTADLIAKLREAGVDDADVLFETFGPTKMKGKWVVITRFSGR